MKVISVDEMKNVSGGIYENSDGWIVVWGAVAAATVISGGAIAITAAVLTLIQTGSNAGAFK